MFFETFVGDDDHWLPPDNFQEVPDGRIAHRTSPTNMGLLLLSTLAAHDLGYIGLGTLVERLEKTFDTLDRLEKHWGHFYNWYDTRDAPAAAAAVRLDGRQRQPAGLPDRARAGPAARRPRRRSSAPAVIEGLADTLGLATESGDGPQERRGGCRPCSMRRRPT